MKKFSYPKKPYTLYLGWKETTGKMNRPTWARVRKQISDKLGAIPFDWDNPDGASYLMFFGFDELAQANSVREMCEQEGYEVFVTSEEEETAMMDAITPALERVASQPENASLDLMGLVNKAKASLN